MASRVSQQREELQAQDYARILMCQKIFEPIYCRSNLTGGELQKQQRVTEHPLYKTLLRKKRE